MYDKLSSIITGFISYSCQRLTEIMIVRPLVQTSRFVFQGSFRFSISHNVNSILRIDDNDDNQANLSPF